MGTIWVGTSGYNYPEWKGSFYPQELPASQMLGYYSARFSTVEINYSFYRLPSEKSIGRWAETTPDGFAFTLKAPRRITHEARLRDCEELTALFCARAQTLGPKLGVLLFQLPPYLRANVEALEEFVGWLPSGVRAAFEFRRVLAVRRGVRVPAGTQPGAVRDGQRDDNDAPGEDGGLRLLPPAGRGLRGGGHPRLGGHGAGGG